MMLCNILHTFQIVSFHIVALAVGLSRMLRFSARTFISFSYKVCNLYHFSCTVAHIPNSDEALGRWAPGLNMGVGGHTPKLLAEASLLHSWTTYQVIHRCSWQALSPTRAGFLSYILIRNATAETLSIGWRLVKLFLNLLFAFQKRFHIECVPIIQFVGVAHLAIPLSKQYLHYISVPSSIPSLISVNPSLPSPI